MSETCSNTQLLILEDNENRKNFKGLFIVCWVFYIHQLFSVGYKRYKRNQIKKDFLIINGGHIEKMNQIHKSPLILIYYSFNSQNKIYKYNYPYERGFDRNINKIDFDIIYRKSVPVIIEKGNPANSAIIFHPDDFKYYNLKFPDSLK